MKPVFHLRTSASSADRPSSVRPRQAAANPGIGKRSVRAAESIQGVKCASQEEMIVTIENDALPGNLYGTVVDEQGSTLPGASIPVHRQRFRISCQAARRSQWSRSSPPAKRTLPPGSIQPHEQTAFRSRDSRRLGVAVLRKADPQMTQMYADGRPVSSALICVICG